ncbi:hypothetical protein ERO13_A03G073000v2 [Gossypium hirsutum]|nr:hypothetical protein ERO13_A03G073000v2 [Gossypium hirsutum]
MKHRFKANTPRTWPKSVEQPRNACFFSFFDLTRMENSHQQGTVLATWRYTTYEGCWRPVAVKNWPNTGRVGVGV